MSDATMTPVREQAAAQKVSGYYQLIEGGDGAFRFTLRAGNHETILESVVYWTRHAALEAVATLRQLGPDSAAYRSLSDPDGRLRFEVIDRAGRVIARSAEYSTRSGCMAGMAAVRRHCTSTVFRGLVRRTTVAS